MTTYELLQEINTYRTTSGKSALRNNDYVKVVSRIYPDLDWVEELPPQVNRGGNRNRIKVANLTDEQVTSITNHYFGSALAYGDREHGALCAIEQLLNISLTRQFAIGKYRIDGYDEENKVAYEIDEPQHFINGQLKPECIERQQWIEKTLGCTFKRIKV